MSVDRIFNYEVFVASLVHSNETSLVYGLAEEAGEVLGKYKRLERDMAGVKTPEWRAALLLELGDLQYYLTAILLQNGYRLGECMAENIVKLTARQQRGVLGGSGDAR